jgi:sirohydrochlorin cobaltochelatase
VPRCETTLIIVGHGTSLNENSKKAIETQVALIRDGGYGFAEVLDTYMEEAPFVAKWDELASAPTVVVVPFFIADALHSYQDIPVLLGIETEPTSAASQNDVFRHNPIALRGKNLFYSSSIGTDPLMSTVILDQVSDFDAKHGPAIASASRPAVPLPPCPFSMGQIMIAKSEHGWAMCHSDDIAQVETLTAHSDVLKARELAMLDDAGNFRALKAAPTLKHGWRLNVATESELRLALECFYPGAIGLWESSLAGTLRPVPLRDTLGRQTGMYRFANTISDDQANEMVVCECDPFRKCARRITWPLNSSQQLSSLPPEKRPQEPWPTDEIPLLCVEACTHLVSAAREIARANYSAK